MNKNDEERIKTWVYAVWPTHWAELAPVSNSRAQFLKYAVRDNFDDEKLKTIALAIIAQTKHWRMKAKADKFGKLTGIPTLSVWYNQQRYNDEFIDESAVSIKARTSTGTCQWEKCNEEVHGPAFKYCTDHQYQSTDSWKLRRKKAMQEMGMMPLKGEGQKEWASRCRQYLKENYGNSLGMIAKDLSK